MKSTRTALRALEKKCDRLFQIKFIEKNPKSIISGEPTEVCHHYIPKSQSNYLRFDFNNGIALTNKEHCRHHLSGDPSIVSTIVLNKGKEWVEELQRKRQIICKNNKIHLEEVFKELSSL